VSCSRPTRRMPRANWQGSVNVWSGGDRRIDAGQPRCESDEGATAIHGAAGRAASLAVRLGYARMAQRRA
jgi:hypothetical protein